MSIEYTIDIQLTELGFPDILQRQETESTCHTTLSEDDSLSSQSSTSRSNTTQQKQVLRSQESAAGKEAKCQPILKATSPVSGVLDPIHDIGHTEADEGSSPPALSEPTITDPVCGEKFTQLGNEQEEDGEKHGADRAQDISMEGQQGEVDDSGDSEVSEVYDEEEIEEEEEEQEEQNSETEEHHCSICDLTLSSKFKLQDHMNLHTGARPYCCAECGKRFCQIYNYRVHLRTHALNKAELQSCRICLKVFTSQKDLKKHLSRNHFEDKFYECDLCKRVFTTLKACEYHVQLHKHMSIVCDQCSRTFTTQKALKRHRSGSKCHSNFKCTDCPKTFIKKNALLKHSFSHLDLLPYTCVRCRCHFRLAKLYRQHKCKPERIHCVACLREFISQEDFQQHKKDTGCWGNQESNGDEIRCLECGQRFETTEELKQHAGAHQRVLKCAECGKGFRSALLLMSHMGGHAGQSPCLCQRCGLGFPHQQNYDSHLKTCGKTQQSVKHQTSKSSSSDKTKTSSGVKKSSSSDAKQHAKNMNASMHPNLSTQMNTSNHANAVTTPVVINYLTTPDKDSWSPYQVTGGVSAVNSSSDRSWKLTLDKDPPPGMKLVLLLPVCSTQTNGLTVPATVPQSLEAQPSPVSNHGHLGGALLNVPMDLVPGIQQGLEREQPLDLSKKCTSPESAVKDVTIKQEPEENEVSGETERQKIKTSNNKAKHFVSLKDLCAHGGSGSHGRIKDIKEEPQFPSSDLQPSTSCQLTDWKPDKEIKMEVDFSHPTCPSMG